MLKLTKRPKSPYYVARGTIDGKRVEISTKREKLPEAREELKRILAERTTRRVETGADMSFETALRAYEEAKPNARFLEPISRHFIDMTVGEITGAELKRAANALYPSAAPSTIRRQLYTPVKAILNMASEDGGFSVARIKAPSGGNKRTAFLLPSQVDKLLKALEANQNPYLAVMVTFLLGQGARLGEALTLQADAVSLEHRFAILRDTKNGEERRVSLIPKVVKAMSALPTIEAGGTVFRRKDGAAYRYGNASGGQISKVFRTAAIAAGLDPGIITPHVCRHTWATWFYAQTKDVRRLQDEGGWKSGEWQRYTKLGTPDLGRSALRAGWNFRESA
ncbi:tyrosine-type recombinase/integrase [Aureimonas ureilytica]|uniref:tyrosine-type recombinase/integrase n=1 Tax=Aureimonas ureilytica TaxID=401562 RepID=UPI00037ABE05|nr:site-specific integrase [Aureimonas ureilytica]